MSTDPERPNVTTVDEAKLLDQEREIIRWISAGRCPECGFTVANCTCGPMIQELVRLALALRARISELERERQAGERG